MHQRRYPYLILSKRHHYTYRRKKKERQSSHPFITASPKSNSHLDKLKSLILIKYQALNIGRLTLQCSSSLLRASLLLLASKDRSLALVVKNLVLALDDLISLLSNPLLLSQLNKSTEVNLSASSTWAWALVIEAVENIGIDSRRTNSGLDGRVCIIDVLWEKLEEGLGECRGSVVVGINKSVCLVGKTTLIVVTMWLRDLVGMRLVIGVCPLLHRTDLRPLLLAAADELIIPVETDTCRGALAVAPLLVVLFVALEDKALRS